MDCADSESGRCKVVIMRNGKERIWEAVEAAKRGAGHPEDDDEGSDGNGGNDEPAPFIRKG